MNEALETRQSDPRRYRAAHDALPFFNSETKRYIHLTDGGISDNLGMRGPLERISAMGNIERAVELSGLERPDHLIVIIVNAETEPDPQLDLTRAAPGLAAAMNLVSGAQIRRYNFETIQLTHSTVAEWAATLSRPGQPVTGHVIEVGFDLIEDEEERRYFKRLPTSFKLSEQAVDRLREIGARLLRESPHFQAALEAIR
jgi:NTE family protein